MPGYDTHYLFGIKAFRALPESMVKQAIHRKKEAYVLGMLGPDIFFYYATEVVAVRKNIGSIMHTQKTDLFLRSMIDYVAKLDVKHNSAEIAYLCGFLTHYYLDAICHPFVYWRTDYLHRKVDYLRNHYQYENDIDVALLRIMRNTTPYAFSKVSQIKIEAPERERVCKMLHYAIRKTYEGSKITLAGIRLAILSIQKEQRMLKLFSGTMKIALESVEQCFMGQSYLAPFIPGVDHEIHEDPLNLRHDRWSNPWKTDKHSTDSVPDMLEKATEQFGVMAHLLEDYIYEFRKDKMVYRVLLRRIGNASYHSGLDWNIPS